MVVFTPSRFYRWKYYKGRDRLLNFLDVLEKQQQPYRLSVVGESFRNHPSGFAQIATRFSDRIENWGFLESRAKYDRLLRKADVVLSTALHDFQGLSLLAAAYRKAATFAANPMPGVRRCF